MKLLKFGLTCSIIVTIPVAVVAFNMLEIVRGDK